MNPVIMGAVLGLAISTQMFAENKDVRVDHFDQHGRRTGYSVIDPKSGRIENFDKDSKRIGSGQITPPPAEQGKKEVPPTPPQR